MKYALIPLIFTLFLCTGCDSFLANERAPGDIPITFTDLSKSVDCGYDVTIDKDIWRVNYLAFYLSEPELKVEGRWVPLTFVPNKWQSKKVAFLSFHHACDTQQSNEHIVLDANAALLKRATELRFNLGLNFDENHSSRVEQVSPLDKPTMFQSTRVGHNFFRLELQNTQQPNAIWSFLLASGGCNADSDDDKPQRCAFPNRMTVDLPMAQNVSNLNLDAALQQILFRVDLKAVAECNMAQEHDESCEKVMRNLTERQWIRWDAPEKVYLKS
ncbi:MbnP family protein [Alteromonas sp. C1M14]|uniref:MbnP family protein n=1 Tax=Alteromonas sp. C1M14 TaxID=2841567 RepID=UPI001C093DED|nr:MbnP family protein [Alteromonas sp. C1M14]MBU2977787.1 metallo-mystery pair system four-Cys motif protein [Alteromonas sp. C1M14]